MSSHLEHYERRFGTLERAVATLREALVGSRREVKIADISGWGMILIDGVTSTLDPKHGARGFRYVRNLAAAVDEAHKTWETFLAGVSADRASLRAGRVDVPTGKTVV